ncbi:ran-binding protein 16 isoform X1 [Oratosquilla oratoria]|uniref:ran-binding protein 16 isoform X1 n=1 Tax=Oratosquilla oratoria TaxID=337810 RepID=UPI003F7665EB
MAEEQEVVNIELLCKQLHEASDGVQRQEAEKALVEFQSGTGAKTLAQCQMLLERAASAYSQYLAATTLTKMVSRNPCTLSLQQRIDIRNYVLNYLATHPKLVHYVTQGLVVLFGRITKLGWFDSVDKEKWAFRNVVVDVTQFLQGSVEHCMMGVQLLAQLTAEMNQISESDANKSLTKHRKIAGSFRDTQLYEIFQLSCQLLRSALESSKTLNFNDESQHGLLTHLLRLALNCLTFDFIGTSVDESSDDLGTVQIPTSWRPAFLDFSTVQLFFDLYASLPSSLSPVALSCLVQIASVRRTLFSNEERAKFLSQLVSGVRNILQNPQGLSDPSNYHEFCRLLLRLKSNYQLGELVTVEHYPEAIQLIAKFTVESLNMWQFAPNSVHYLLSLWQRMVGSVPYMKAAEPHLLETYTPEVVRAYVSSRLESAGVVLREGLEDPLDDVTVIQQQLDQLSTIGRCEYGKTCALLVQLFEQTAQRYQELITARMNSPSQQQPIEEIAILEGQLTWLVYMIGSAIGGRVSFNTSDDHDAMDGELVCRVLQLMNLTDSCLPQGGCERLELAMISFFEQFRKIYVGDQVHKTSKFYRTLSEILGLTDESMVLAVFVRKIITNLKYWGHCEQILTRTLTLLSDLSVGYNSVRKLVKLEEVQFMLNNHTNEHFPFLGVGVSVQEMRSRTLFYTSLGRLLMVDLGEDEEKFTQFMLPITSAFDNVGRLLAQAGTAMFQAEDAKKGLIGLARDLRGLAYAFNTKTSYMMLFDWIYPSYTEVLVLGVKIWSHDPQVTTPVLKLFAELVQNRSQRLQFDVSSPNGILLFREASKVICTYGSRILARGDNIPKEQIYPMRLKGISICFSMLKAALCGNYVNFGVFRLYGDDALDTALHTFVKLLLSIPQSDLLVYPKLSQTYYVLLECLAQDHMNFLSTFEPNVFLYILSSISEGLSAIGWLQIETRESHEWHRLIRGKGRHRMWELRGRTHLKWDTMVCTGCCATLDHIVTHLFKTLHIKSKKGNVDLENDALVRVMKHQPHILQQMLATVLNIIMFEDCRNQWSMSRPLLPLILLNEEYFGQLRQQIISQQAPDKEAAMAQWFENLMEGIEPNLLTKNRDKFTQNLSVFRRDINDSLKGPLTSSSGTSGGGSEMMTS